jgi:TolB-like protein
MRVWIETEPPGISADPDRDMPEFVRLYYEVRKEINEERYCPAEFTEPHPCQYAVQLDPGVKTVAVIDFENLSIDEPERLAPMSRALAHIFMGHLKAADRLIVVDRELLGIILNEIDLNQTDAVDRATAVRIGRVLGAHSILGGSFMNFNGELSIQARLIEVETTKVLLADDAKGKLKAFQGISTTLAEKILKSLDIQIEKGAFEGSSAWTNELEALLETAEGNDLFDRGELLEAREKYEEALQYDPNYGLARQMLEAVNSAIQGEEQTGQK